MRIMYCLPEMSHPGGIARVESIKANWLVSHNHDVHIVTTDQKGKDIYYQLDNRVCHTDIGVDFTSYEDSNVISKFFKRKKKVDLFEVKLKDIVSTWKPDIIVSTFNNERDFLYKWNDGSKKILEYHFCHEMNRAIIKYGNLNIIQKLVLKIKDKHFETISRKYDAFVVLTQEDSKYWKGYNNLHIIPNMLSFESQEISNCMAKRVIAVGRLDFQKKFDRLIDIWTDVNKQFPDWHLDIFGQGPDKEILLLQIKENGLTDSVIIHNPTQNIRDEYLKSSIIVMTSTYEGWGLVLTEGMTCGLPCVAYACTCGPRDIIIDGENGRVINEGSKDEFVAALLNLIGSYELRKCMGYKSKSMSQKWSTDEIMGKWINLFNEIRK